MTNPNPNPPENTPETEATLEGSGALTRVVVAIIRDANTTLSADVLAYELPVMEAIYGEDGEVSVVEEHEAVDPDTFDVDAAWHALRRKYEKFPGVVNQVYRNQREFEQAVGQRSESESGAAVAASSQKVRKAPAKKAAAKRR